MKAWQLAAPETFERIEMEPPGNPPPGMAIVRSRVMGICGTDASCYYGKFPFFEYPRIPGHELGVEVLEVGSNAHGISPGQRCSVEPYLHCGTCYACRRGATNCCANLKVIGVMMNGGLCERFMMPANKLHTSDKLDFEQLALVETLAIGCHAVARGNPQRGDFALVVGAGPIGLSAIEFLLLAGTKVVVMDLSQSRIDFCRQHYAIHDTILVQPDAPSIEAVNRITSGDRFPLVIDATGHAQSMSEALSFVAPTGTLVYVGITTGEIRFVHPAFHRPEITLKASRNAMPGDFGNIIGLIEQGKIDTGRWISHRTTFDKVKEDFPRFLKPENQTVKAVIHLD